MAESHSLGDGERGSGQHRGGAPAAGKEWGGHLDEGTPGRKEEGEAERGLGETAREGGGEVGQADTRGNRTQFLATDVFGRKLERGDNADAAGTDGAF